MKAEELTQRYKAGEKNFPGVVIEKKYLGLLKVKKKSGGKSGGRTTKTI